MLKVGTILRGTYRIDSYLSSGGFGNTYVATNIEFDERVAIKEFFMKGVTQRDENQTTVSVSNAENHNSFLEQKEKFKKEARRLRKLKNEYIVGVHDLFEENGTAYYVMDYVDGENLAERLKRTGQPMSEKEVREILPQVLDALKSVHDAKIWHLDLKPANIMVDKSGHVRLIDFGASKQLNSQKGGATTSTAISYTNGYAPREQMEQNYDKFGPWTDFYALGATLFNLLTNKRPPLPTDIDDDISDDKHLALPFLAGVSEDMKKFILQLMHTNRRQRPQNVSELLMVLDQSPSISKMQDNSPADDEETIIASEESGGDYSFEMLLKRAEEGDADAQYNLGRCYDNGKGVEKDKGKAFQLYKKAAEQGNIDALFCLGYCYDKGEGIEQDKQEAYKWYKKAAKQGNASARGALNNMKLEDFEEFPLINEALAICNYYSWERARHISGIIGGGFLFLFFIGLFLLGSSEKYSFLNFIDDIPTYCVVIFFIIFNPITIMILANFIDSYIESNQKAILDVVIEELDIEVPYPVKEEFIDRERIV